MNEIAEKISRIGTKILHALLTAFAILLIVYSGFVLYDTIYTGRVAFLSSDLSQYRPGFDEDEPDFEDMLKINPDTRAWIVMLNTNIDYPVVQGKNDLEYSMKDVYGKNSLTGSIYLSCINNGNFTDSFNMIYGHHMDNGAMFGDIAKYAKKRFFYSHQDGILVTKRGAYDLHVFARLSADAYDERVYMAGDRPSEDFPDFLYYIKSLAMQWDPETDIEGITANIKTYIKARNENIRKNGRFVFKDMPENAVKNGMQLVALSTCADAATNGRQLLVCTMKFRTDPLPDIFGKQKEKKSPWGHGVVQHWALLNAICLIMILVIWLPGRLIRRKFRKVYWRGLLIEAVIAVFSIIWFIWTENPWKPMVIVDRWTVGMIALFGVMLAVDHYLIKIPEHQPETMDDPSSPGSS